jgi:hypothetical protein
MPFYTRLYSFLIMTNLYCKRIIRDSGEFCSAYCPLDLV